MSIEKLSTNASLKDVMDKFEEIGFQDFSSIDIIVVDELPTKVKNGQLCILKDNFTGHIYMADETPSNIQEGDMFIKTNNDITGSKEFVVNDSKSSINLIIRAVRIFEGGVLVPVTAYLGEGDVWNILEKTKCVVFNNGAFDSIIGGMKHEVVATDSNSSTSHTIGKTLTLTQSGKSNAVGKNQLTTNKLIDLSVFDYLHIDIYAKTSSANSYIKGYDCQVQIINSSGTVVAKYDPSYSKISTPSPGYYEISRRTYKLDIKNVLEPCYRRIYGACGCESTTTISNTITVYSLILGGEVIED